MKIRYLQNFQDAIGCGIWWLGREPNSTEIYNESSSYADSTLADTNKVPAKMMDWD